MVKKLKKMAEKQAAGPSGLLDSQLAQTVKDSAQQIWLAGLGAFAKAQGEGAKLFDSLMKEGASLHRKTQSAAEEKLDDAAGRMSAMAGGVGSKASAHWDKLESIFEERTARAMGRLGVPSAKEVAALAERVDALAAALGKLGQTASAAKPAAKPSAKATPGKSARKTTAAAPAASKPAAKPAAEPASKPAAKPAPKPAAEPASKPAAKPAARRRKTGQSAARSGA